MTELIIVWCEISRSGIYEEYYFLEHETVWLAYFLILKMETVYFPMKYQYTCTRLHDITFQKIVLFKLIIIFKTSDPIQVTIMFQ